MESEFHLAQEYLISDIVAELRGIIFMAHELALRKIKMHQQTNSWAFRNAFLNWLAHPQKLCIENVM